MATSLELLALAKLAFYDNKPSFTGYATASQSLNNQTWTAMSITATVDDNWSGHSNVTNPSRYTSQVAGWYLVNGVYTPVANATGFRAVRLQKNGSPVIGSGNYGPNNGGTAEQGMVSPTTEIFLAVGDYVEVAGWQSSGAALGTVTDPDLRTALTVTFNHF